MLGIGSSWLIAQSGPPDESKSASTPPKTNVESEPRRDEPVKAILSGKVILLAEAFKRKGIKSYQEEIAGDVVLETRAGELIPIVPDWRGRAFYQDERLRDRPVDLVVNRRPGIPWVQVLSIYTFDEEGVRNITDYWCDICAIPMYEIKECDCCRAPIRLRFRPEERHKESSTNSTEKQRPVSP